MINGLSVELYAADRQREIDRRLQEWAVLSEADRAVLRSGGLRGLLTSIQQRLRLSPKPQPQPAS